MTARRLVRSYLYAPGDNPRLLARVAAAGADAVILDLEDAVAPERKTAARMLVAEALALVDGPGPLHYVRINSVSSGEWADDLDAVVCRSLAGVRVPKAESRAEIEAVLGELRRLEAVRGLSPGAIAVVPTIESARGLLRADDMASLQGVEALAFGATDFLRDVGASTAAGDAETLYARSHLVVVSRAHDLRPPIASVHPLVADDEGLLQSSYAARRLGFFGRSCIHPRQVPIVHEAFAPTQDEVAEARAVIAAFERAGSAQSGSVALQDGRFVDRAVAERARQVLALVEGLGGLHDQGTRPS